MAKALAVGIKCLVNTKKKKKNNKDNRHEYRCKNP